MHKKWVGVSTGLLIIIGFVFSGDPISAQRTKGKTRLAQTKYLMKGIAQPATGGLAASLKETGPADDKAWETAVGQASVLNELSYLLMDDGRCPDAVWAGASQDLRAGSAQLAEALEKKDLEAARAAFKTTTVSCATCHKAHKNKT